MKKIYCYAWGASSDETEIKEEILYSVLLTFGGGMGGANKTYYTRAIKNSELFNNEKYILIDNFGENVEINLDHVVEIKKCLVVELYNEKNNHFRVFCVGREDQNYEIKYSYDNNWYQDLIYDNENYKKDYK
jgi:hypothetical protein